VSIEDSSLESEWCTKTGSSSYNAINKSTLKLLTERLSKSCSSTWQEMFDYSGTQNITDEQYDCISERALRYCKIEERKGWRGGHKGYKLYPSTAFVFQLVAELIAGNKTDQSNACEIAKELLNSKYTSAILIFVGNDISVNELFSQIGNIKDNGYAVVGDGHALDTYYVLMNNYSV
jgi:hypothetical protein